MKILITGANGFIGSNVVRKFFRTHEVTALVRETSNTEFIDNYPVKIIKNNLKDYSVLKEFCSDMDLVIHIAALAADWGEYEKFYETNVNFSVELIKAIDDKTKFIYISSNAVLGEEDSTFEKDENADYKPVLNYTMEKSFPCAMNFYRLTKAIGEELLIKHAEKNKIDLTVLRPVWVFGPREFHAGPYEYCKTVMDGIPLMPGTSKNKFHVIYVEDLAGIILKISESMKKGINIYNLGNKEIPLMEDYWKEFCKNLKKKKPINIPEWILFVPGFLMELFYTILKIKTPPLFTRARIYMFYANNMYNTEKVFKDYEINNMTPLDKAIRKTVRWWKLNKYL